MRTENFRILPLHMCKGFFFLLFSICFVAEAQFYDPIKESIKLKPGLDLRYDSRNSFVDGRYAAVRGVKLGLRYGDALRMGVGYNWLHSDIIRSIDASDSALFKLEYFSPYFEWAFHNDDRWEISTILMLGFGSSRYEYNIGGTDYSTRRYFTMIYEPAMTAEYHFLKYFFVGAGVGYRLAVSSDSFTKQRVNSPIYLIKFGVEFRKVQKDFLPPVTF